MHHEEELKEYHKPELPVNACDIIINCGRGLGRPCSYAIPAVAGGDDCVFLKDPGACTFGVAHLQALFDKIQEIRRL